MNDPAPTVAGEEPLANAPAAESPGVLASEPGEPAVPSHQREPFGSSVVRAAGAFAIWRGLLCVFMALGLTMTQPNPREQRRPDNLWQAFPASPFWDSWARWDSGWYQMVVEKGYFSKAGEESDIAFFPLFPYATRALAAVVGNHWVAGLLVSNVSLIGALVFLRRIGLLIFDSEATDRALVYLLVFPGSFFLSAYYSEGLFLLTSVAAFSMYLEGRFVACGVWGLLAAMTRPTGIAIAPALAVGLGWQIVARRSKFRPSMLVGLLLIPCGLLLFMLILYIKVGDPLAFIAAHGAWGRSRAAPHLAIVDAIRSMDWSLSRDLIRTITFLDAVTAIAFLLLPLTLFGKCDPALPVYSMLLILVPLSTGSVKSMIRLESVAFPAFLALARLGASRTADRAIVCLFALFLGLFSLLFANWYWVG